MLHFSKYGLPESDDEEASTEVKQVADEVAKQVSSGGGDKVAALKKSTLWSTRIEKDAPPKPSPQSGLGGETVMDEDMSQGDDASVADVAPGDGENGDDVEFIDASDTPAVRTEVLEDKILPGSRRNAYAMGVSANRMQVRSGRCFSWR